jgi:hypothetical protein
VALLHQPQSLLGSELNMEGYRALEAASAILFRARPEAWVVIIGFIWPMAALTLRHLLRVRRQLASERKALQACRAALDLMLREGKTVDGERVEAALREIAPNGLVATAVRTLWDVRLLPSVELEAIVAMLQESEAARLGTARSVPNRLMLLGLLGTVAGLAGVIGTLGPQIQGTLDHPDAVA